jgi:hypothetical protein
MGFGPVLHVMDSFLPYHVAEIRRIESTTNKRRHLVALSSPPPGQSRPHFQSR